MHLRTNLHHTITARKQEIIDGYLSFIANRQFPCVAAKAALARQQIQAMVAGHMACPMDDANVLRFLYDFVDQYKRSKELYHSATVIFESPADADELEFDDLLWQRLQGLANLDAEKYSYDNRVSSDPHSPHFSFSLKGEAFFIIGLHPRSSRPARRFAYPTLVFNPHEQFEVLRRKNHYQAMKEVVRKRDMQFSGSINPMLDDFGSSSEVLQYSGRKYDKNWTCPLQINHANTKNNPTT